MPLIAPFKGLRYNPKRVRSLSRVVTQPYDIITPEGQAAYYRKHPFNFIRVVYGRAYPTDTKKQNRYSRANRTLEEWLKKGVLQVDQEPAVYPYLQEYTLKGKRYQRWGVVTLVRLDSPDIYPHEETRPAPKLDRLRLLEMVGASLSPIFGLIPDLQGLYRRFILSGVARQRPVASVQLDGVRHRLWKMADPARIKKLQNLLRSRELVIADGHHRFEAALTYRNNRKAQDSRYTPRSPYNFAMFYLAAAGREEPGLLPTHRLLMRASAGGLNGFLKKLDDLSVVSPAKNLGTLSIWLQSLRQKGNLGIGLYTADNAEYLLLPKKTPLERMDVEWLHGKLLPAIFGTGCDITYTQDLSLGARLVRQGKAEALFVMQPPSLKEVLERARRSVRMPGKTTYFHPKPLAGLVEYKFNA